MVEVILGTHKPQWLGRLAVPMLISFRRLREWKKLARASADLCIDSGGFTELNRAGSWDAITAADYAAGVRRMMAETGRVRWAAIQDWMCEPFVLKKTGLSVREHQRRTVDSYARLLDLAPEVPWAPVLQGYATNDYLEHLDDYRAAGFDLARAPVVGLGSVCRRQHTGAAELLVRMLAKDGLRLHGFGFKVLGLRRVADVLASSDSLAWSFDARHRPPMDGCTHARCSNCPRWAMRWLERTQRHIAEVDRQGELLSRK